MASRLAKRMQVLIDDERFARLEAEAAARRTSVASVVRAAIDEHLASGQVARADAARRLIAQFHEGGEPEPDWAESKQALLDDLAQMTEYLVDPAIPGLTRIEPAALS